MTPYTVRCDLTTLEIVFSKIGPEGYWRDIYHVDLEQLTDGVRVLDVLLKIHREPWMHAVLVKGFLDCLERACWTLHGCKAQHVFCSSKECKTVEWPRV